MLSFSMKGAFMKFFYWFLLFIMLISCKDSQEGAGTKFLDDKALSYYKNTHDLAEYNNQFAFNFLSQAHVGNENIVFSPFSLWMVMNMTYQGVVKGSPSADEMARALSLLDGGNPISRDYLVQAVSELLNRYSGYSELKIANKIWSNQNIELNPDFISVMNLYFKNSFESVDVSNPSLAANRVNQWVSINTDGMIKNLVDASVFSNLLLLLTNTLLVNVKWTSPYEPCTLTFWKDSQSRVDDLKCFKAQAHKATDSNNRLYVLDPNNSSSSIKFVILMPVGTSFDINSIISQLQRDPDYLSGLMNSASTNGSAGEVTVKVPSYILDSDVQAKQVFGSLGLSKVFNQNFDFVEMFKKPNQQAQISEIIHKAKIGVDKDGFKASAASGVAVSKRSIGSLIQNSVDRPFIFAIVDENRSFKNKTVLFVGKVSNAESIEAQVEPSNTVPYQYQL